MRYWLLGEEDEALGPFAPAQLQRRKDFHADSLLCPESFDGDGSSVWVRADRIPDAARFLPPDFHFAAPGGGFIPARLLPDPSTADAAELRSIEERLAEIGSRLLRALDRSSSRGKALKALRGRFLERESELSALRADLKAVSMRLGNFSRLEAELKKISGRLNRRDEELKKLSSGLEGVRRAYEERLSAADQKNSSVENELRAILEESRSALAEVLKTAEDAVLRAEAAVEREKAAEESAREARQFAAEAALKQRDAARIARSGKQASRSKTPKKDFFS